MRNHFIALLEMVGSMLAIPFTPGCSLCLLITGGQCFDEHGKLLSRIPWRSFLEKGFDVFPVIVARNCYILKFTLKF